MLKLWKKIIQGERSRKEKKLPRSLGAKLRYIEKVFQNVDDLVIRKMKIGDGAGIPAAVIFIDGMVDSLALYEQLLKSPTLEVRQISPGKESRDRDLLAKVKGMLPAGEVSEATDWEEAVEHLLIGHALFCVDGLQKGLAIDINGWARRNVEQPVLESVIRGPRDSFTESVRTNTTLIRRRLRDPG
jgi:hypothetical protein